MSGTHPIDEIFRRSLRGAVAVPPPELGPAILTHVRAGRRRGLFWRRRLLVALFLLMGTTVSIVWMMPSGKGTKTHVEIAAAQPAAATNDAPGLAASGNSPETIESVRDEGHQQAPATGQGVRAPVQPQGPVTPRREAPRPSAPSPQAMRAEAALEAASGKFEGGTTSNTSGDRDGGTRANSLVDKAQERMTERLDWLNPVPWASATPEQGPWKPLMMKALRPRGSWWAAITVSAQSSRQQWTSESGNLQRALQGNGRWQSGFAIGVLACRSWPSGWSLGFGVEADRTVQTYRNLDRRTEQRTETVTHVITLNTQVFTASVDTISTEVVRESKAEGTDDRVRLRIPLEAAWQLAIKRWRFGPRLGLVAERTSVRSSASLAIDPSDGMVRARQLPSAELQARYPLSLSCLAGIDLGFCASERSRIIATPFATRALALFGPAADAHASPERFGMRLMLQHRF